VNPPGFLRAALQVCQLTVNMATHSETWLAIASLCEFYGVWVAESYALINHKQEALEWLEEAINNQLLNYPFLTKHDRFLKNLHNEEGFKKLMKRVKKEWETFEV